MPALSPTEHIEELLFKTDIPELALSSSSIQSPGQEQDHGEELSSATSQFTFSDTIDDHNNGNNINDNSNNKNNDTKQKGSPRQWFFKSFHQKSNNNNSSSSSLFSSSPLKKENKKDFNEVENVQNGTIQKDSKPILRGRRSFRSHFKRENNNSTNDDSSNQIEVAKNHFWNWKTSNSSIKKDDNITEFSKSTSNKERLANELLGTLSSKTYSNTSKGKGDDSTFLNAGTSSIELAETARKNLKKLLNQEDLTDNETTTDTFGTNESVSNLENEIESQSENETETRSESDDTTQSDFESEPVSEFKDEIKGIAENGNTDEEISPLTPIEDVQEKEKLLVPNPYKFVFETPNEYISRLEISTDAQIIDKKSETLKNFQAVWNLCTIGNAEHVEDHLTNITLYQLSSELLKLIKEGAREKEKLKSTLKDKNDQLKKVERDIADKITMNSTLKKEVERKNNLILERNHLMQSDLKQDKFKTDEETHLEISLKKNKANTDTEQLENNSTNGKEPHSATYLEELLFTEKNKNLLLAKAIDKYEGKLTAFRKNKKISDCYKTESLDFLCELRRSFGGILTSITINQFDIYLKRLFYTDSLIKSECPDDSQVNRMIKDIQQFYRHEVVNNFFKEIIAQFVQMETSNTFLTNQLFSLRTELRNKNNCISYLKNVDRTKSRSRSSSKGSIVQKHANEDQTRSSEAVPIDATDTTNMQSFGWNTKGPKVEY
ncbi:Ysw1p NDAI_0A07010 [Naumovozyma dairenensis CBS 421]|uniref:Uncharacterized protein n=1 Tax=Naumovozyma dairenensis (strain ATCC 10597 / BCRC 20456 / CBS 421 / NBRC 0211 / NRRL Y-12639) TaxID=1071378 RepID=G0W4W7_NAUDC|nr:hypothetical protein NDAI_0A07010 [Naumovozyma dairenensis CBS 421]CCD22855.1 hypothetical protein NDAI_0A07010 [Naumovozyma dairenensis CBS 421]